ncbi:MAG TPA: STAS domain-containing protein [Bacillota bacterium]|nr:STAS domain-containing protein [Bacillota bacterium]
MIELEETNQQVKVKISGDIFVEQATVLREKLIPFTQKKGMRFLLDLTSVSYIDSSGLGVLVAIQKRALQNGGGVQIKGLQGHVKELFELTRLTKVFEMV